MNKLIVRGFAALTPCGYGKYDLFHSISEKKDPNVEEVKLERGEGSCQVLKIPKHKLTCDVPVAVLRRMGPLTNYVLSAVLKALDDAELKPEELERTGFIFSSPLGPSHKIDRYVKKVVKYGEMGASPIMFSTSVHNATASFVSQTLGLVGPISTVTNMELSLASSLELASTWISSGLVDRVILASGDEVSSYDIYDFYDRNVLVDYSQYSPLSQNNAIAGEAVVAIVLEKNQDQKGKAIIEGKTGITLKSIPTEGGVFDAKGAYRMGEDIYSKYKMQTLGKRIGSTPSVCCSDLAYALESIEMNKQNEWNLFQVSDENIAAKIKVDSFN